MNLTILPIEASWLTGDTPSQKHSVIMTLYACLIKPVFFCKCFGVSESLNSVQSEQSGRDAVPVFCIAFNLFQSCLTLPQLYQRRGSGIQPLRHKAFFHFHEKRILYGIWITLFIAGKTKCRILRARFIDLAPTARIRENSFINAQKTLREK
jgi:hypothetical protein